MFNSKKSITVVALLLLLTAAPLLALEGSAKFSVPQNMFIAGKEIKAGAYNVKYKSNSPEATVAFVVNGKIVLEVQGKIEELGKNNDYTSLLIGKDSAGRQAINGMRFAGKKTAITF